MFFDKSSKKSNYISLEIFSSLDSLFFLDFFIFSFIFSLMIFFLLLTKSACCLQAMLACLGTLPYPAQASDLPSTLASYEPMDPSSQPLVSFLQAIQSTLKVGCLERVGICNKVMGHKKGAYFLHYACV